MDVDRAGQTLTGCVWYIYTRIDVGASIAPPTTEFGSTNRLDPLTAWFRMIHDVIGQLEDGITLANDGNSRCRR